MSIYRRLPGTKANTLPKTLREDRPVKTTHRTDQTALVCYLLTLRVCADKAVRCKKGDLDKAAELQHNSIRVCVLFLLHGPFFPAVTQR